MYSMVGIPLGLPEIWIQLYGVWEVIHVTPSTNIGHCIEQVIFSQKLWTQSIWEVKWGLKDVHSMLGILSGLPEIWIQLYSVWEMIHFIPSENMGHCIEHGIYSHKLWNQSIWEVIRGLKSLHGKLGMLSEFPELWIQLYGVIEMIHFTPSANIGHCIEQVYTFRICEIKVSEKWYEDWRMYIAC